TDLGVVGRHGRAWVRRRPSAAEPRDHSRVRRVRPATHPVRPGPPRARPVRRAATLRRGRVTAFRRRPGLSPRAHPGRPRPRRGGGRAWQDRRGTWGLVDGGGRPQGRVTVRTPTGAGGRAPGTGLRPGPVPVVRVT